MSKIKHILSVIHYTICGAVCVQFTHFSLDDWENIYTLSYNHHQIGGMNYYPLFRVRSWNSGVRCMSFCILKNGLQRVPWRHLNHIPHTSTKLCEDVVHTQQTKNHLFLNASIRAKHIWERPKDDRKWSSPCTYWRREPAYVYLTPSWPWGKDPILLHMTKLWGRSFKPYKLQITSLQITKLVQNAFNINSERITYISHPMQHI